jgi:hypothetical protein
MDRNPEILIRRTEKCSANLSQPEPHGIPKGHAYFVTDGSDGRWGEEKVKKWGKCFAFQGLEAYFRLN